MSSVGQEEFGTQDTKSNLADEETMPNPDDLHLVELEATRVEVAKLRVQLETLRQINQRMKDELRSASLSQSNVSDSDVIELNDERALQEVGIYHYNHPLQSAELYKARLKQIQSEITSLVQNHAAIVSSDMFTFNNSLAKGRKMTGDLSRLMLRAYNAEADNCVRSLKAGSLVIAVKRLESTLRSIAKLGSMMEMRVSEGYHTLRVKELELTSDFLMKVQEERELQREERERLREERKAEQELRAERVRLDKERAHYVNALAALMNAGRGAESADLDAKLRELDLAIAHNEYRQANIRAGYVYVISNVGAFGPGVVKIGLTRRLEPMDRVRELGGASVPFPFDVHALYFSNDAVSLENELHKEFGNRRLNHANLRREFFFATPEEVRASLVSKVGNLLEYADAPEATQYFQSKKYWV